MAKLETGDVKGGSHDLALYEQRVIVQGRIWDTNPDAAEALTLNQTFTQADAHLAQAAARLPLVGPQLAAGIRAAGAAAREGMYHTMRARRTSFALTTDCLPPDGAAEVPFRGDFTQWAPRVGYYDDLVAEYRKLEMDGRAPAVVSTIVGRDPAPPAAANLPRRHGE